MKMDTFVQLIKDLRTGQQQDDTDPSNTVLQVYTSPYDTISITDSARSLNSKISSFVWGSGLTYTANDTNGDSWQAPSCGWLWGSGGIWGGTTYNYIVSDSFNRANGSLGSTDSYLGGTSKTWLSEAGLPMPVISNNTALANSASGNCIGILDAGVSDCSIQADITIKTAHQVYLEFRTTSDASNRTLCSLDQYGNVSVTNYGPGGSTTYASGSVSYADGRTLKVTLKGQNIFVYYNSSFVFSTQSTVNQTSTLHGFGFYQDTTSSIKNYQVY